METKVKKRLEVYLFTLRWGLKIWTLGLSRLLLPSVQKSYSRMRGPVPMENDVVRKMQAREVGANGLLRYEPLTILSSSVLRITHFQSKLLPNAYPKLPKQACPNTPITSKRLTYKTVDIFAIIPSTLDSPNLFKRPEKEIKN